MFVLKKGKWRLILTLIVFLLLQCNGKILRLVDSRSVIMAANKQIPSSPVYSEDRKQVTFDNIYFGSYPQTEVKGNDLTSSILTASYDTYGDAWVNGTKYRRIRISDTNNAEHFGNKAYRYFKWERVKWRVLNNDGDTLFIMADHGLDCQNYHEVDASVSWMDCSLRKWLNGPFYYTAFSRAERDSIVLQSVDNSGYVNGSNTDDYIYVPSLEEMSNHDYGFSADIKLPSPCRQISATDYAYVMGAVTGDHNGKEIGEPYCWWWTRDPGKVEYNPLNYAALIGNQGIFSLSGRVQNNYQAVVPVMHVKLSSDLWYRRDDGTSGFGGGEPATVPLKVENAKMLRSKNVASVSVKVQGGITSKYSYQWYAASSKTGSGRPLGVMDYKALVWQDNTLYIDLNEDDVPENMYLYCKVSDGRSTITSERVLFSKNKTKQTITYNKQKIKNGKIEYGIDFNLDAKSNGDLSVISYKSSNKNVLTVSSNGRVKVKNYGKATITMTASDSFTSKYGETSIKVTLTVVPKQVKILHVNKKKNALGTIESVLVDWKKDLSVDGFQYSVAYNSQYTNGMNGEKTGKANSIKLSYVNVSKDKLYIRIRAYKKVGKKTYYGRWSSSYVLKL
jgi:Bacterial Ig-like domain (group 2).